MSPELIDVPVRGGMLRVAKWGHGMTPVIASHGLTGSHLLWSRVAEELPESFTLIAPDQRGRGRSAALPAPYGIEIHATDLMAVADHLATGPGIWAGSSIGAWVVSAAAARWPDRISALLLVDGGLTDFSILPADADGPMPEDPNAQTRSSLGPGFDRLSMSFPSTEAYQAFWQEHPAFRKSGGWNAHVAAYVAYDLTGQPPQLRSCVSLDAVRADSADVRHNHAVRTALQHVTCPVWVIRASRGALDQPEPHIRDSVVDQYRQLLPRFTDILIPSTNHLTLPHSPSGAAAIARSLEALAAQSRPGANETETA